MIGCILKGIGLYFSIKYVHSLTPSLVYKLLLIYAIKFTQPHLLHPLFPDSPSAPMCTYFMGGRNIDRSRQTLLLLRKGNQAGTRKNITLMFIPLTTTGTNISPMLVQPWPGKMFFSAIGLSLQSPMSRLSIVVRSLRGEQCLLRFSRDEHTNISHQKVVG